MKAESTSDHRIMSQTLIQWLQRNDRAGYYRVKADVAMLNTQTGESNEGTRDEQNNRGRTRTRRRKAEERAE
ncbi:hypothetical protein E2542_SST01659 [Spatholobus suberectus]|nr:hypothetical protein E2542_SST01659 [Spatholobus suberectus]